MCDLAGVGIDVDVGERVNVCVCVCVRDREFVCQIKCWHVEHCAESLVCG